MTATDVAIWIAIAAFGALVLIFIASKDNRK